MGSEARAMVGTTAGENKKIIMEQDLNKKVGQAAKWSSVTEIGTKLISPITNAVLARLLLPEVFGIVATLTMVTSFAEIFTDAGFQKYLVQHEFDSEKDLDLSTNVAFWTNIVFSLLIWGGIAVFATPIANLVGSAGYESAIIVMSAEIPLLAFSSIQMARYRRDFDFKNLFVARMVVALVPLVITVPCAIIFRSHWALVIGTLTKDVLNAVVLTVRSRWKPRFRFEFQKLKEMLSFSAWTMLENVTIWLTTNAGTFIVVNILGSYYLGLYKTTITTIGGYFSIIQSATMPVLFSALSRSQGNDREFQDIMFRFQRMVALLVLPLGFGILVFRELATQILLGSQWTETADFVGMYSLSWSLVFIFSYYNSEAFRSKGKPMLSVIVQLLYFAALAPALYFSAHDGYAALTVASAAVRVVMIVVSSVIAHFALGISFSAVLKNVWPSLVASVVMAIFGGAIRTVRSGVAWELFCIVLCVLVYAACLLSAPAGRQQLVQVPVVNKLLRLNHRQTGQHPDERND